MSMLSKEMFGDLIRRLRMSKSMQLLDVSKKTTKFLGREKLFSLSYLSKIENDNEIPTPKLTIALAIVLDYDPHKLLDIAQRDETQQKIRKIERRFARALQERRGVK